MRNSKMMFRRAPAWYTLMGWGALLSGGWILWQNVALTRLGLFNDGWSAVNINPIAVGIAVLEGAISIFVTNPENWDEIWDLIEGAGEQVSVGAPRIIKLAIGAIFCVLILAFISGAYAFDFFSTHTGLYGIEAVITFKSMLFTLGYNFGTELLSFFGFQCLRAGKQASIDNLREQATVEPDFIRAKENLRQAREIAKLDVERRRYGNGLR